MAFKLLPFDAELLNKFSMRIRAGGTAQQGGGPFMVPFQFPVVIKSDNKGVNYKEDNSLRNIEPIVIFEGSKPREIALKWTYVATNARHNGNHWTPNFIASTVKRIRAFFYQNIQDFIDGNPIVIEFRAFDMLGSSNKRTEFSFRTDGVTINHSDMIVGNVNIGYYAYKTDIDMKLKLWSKGELKDGNPILKLKWLKSADKLMPEWR